MTAAMQVTGVNAESLSEVQKFYRNKSVFLTGGSGFLGKVFIEKILRATDVKCIYILMRPKKGQAVEERIEAMFKNPLFAELNKLKPTARNRLVPIHGDCQLSSLGISPADRQTLLDEVEIVMHSAATVRFNEPLYNALAINVRATMDLMQLAKRMRKLQAFVHVSSAFANCTVFHVDEVYYKNELNITAENMCKVADLLGPEKTNRMTSEWLGKSPNTYTFTKALAEEAVLSEGKELPICIFRPGIVIPTYSEPIVGWVDNLYGPMSILYGVAHGVVRVLYLHLDTNANFAPVDMCANLMLASAWNTAKQVNQTSSVPPPIYNFVPDERNMLKWQTYRRTLEEHAPKMPLTKMIWYPFVIIVNYKLLYNILILFYHIIPGYIFDFLLLLIGRKRRMIKTYQKLHKQIGVLDYFVEHKFTFTMENTSKLWLSLSHADQKIFNFNIREINWPEYFHNSLMGVRCFMGKEQPETIPKAKRLMQRLLILHRTVQVLVYGGACALMSWAFLRI
ncbi:fatty acyl-CoA reductase wat-like isoform X1 [Bactrocera neohumeralis]|uniref:fatty acyl-CoA reductase wat-like isoform X1 n=1 Tax=Bactrocera neohumeralis TaxID=98809 RepID=UPI002165CB73|nr:fatty acyl-CoA reductase wat-like isoform X1 [Bactrocera neohumeralis]